MGRRPKTAVSAESFRNIREIVQWLQSEGYKVGKTVVYDASKAPGFPPLDREGRYDRAQVEKYALETWVNPKKAAEQREKRGIKNEAENPKLRLQLAMAEEREFKLAILKGKYYLKSEEDQRDAALLHGLKTSVGNWGPFIIDELISMVVMEVGTEVGAKIGQITPDLRMRYRNMVAEKFDELARDGGVEFDCSICPVNGGRDTATANGTDDRD